MLIQLLPCIYLLRFSLLASASASEQKVLHGGAGKANPLNAELKQLVTESLEKWHVPGVSIGVVDGDESWTEGYGIATFPDTPVTPSTLFYGASTTKAFTAAAFSLLIHDSTSGSNASLPSLSWKTPISTLIPSDFILEDPWATAHVTIEDLLSHRTGMPRHDLSYGGTHEGRNATPRDTVRALRYLPLTEEPRVRFQYCNMMYTTASYVLESVTGLWLGDFLKQRIWGPLGMNSTYFSNSDALSSPSHLAQGYVHYNDTYRPVPLMDLGPVSGAGSIISNVQDYSKWLHALIHLSSPIPPEAYKALFTPHMVDEDPDVPYIGPQAYAFGWFVSTYRGYQFFEHSGGMEAFGAQVIFFPELKYGLCGFGNTGQTSNAVQLKAIWKLIDDKLDVPEKDRFDWDGRTERALKQRKKDYNNRTAKFYPTIPSPPLPHSLPLHNYTGTYFHPAYRNFTIYEEDNVLHAKRQDVSWKISVNLKHVSADYFMAFLDSTTAPGLIFRDALAAEFRVGSDGVSSSLGIAFEPEMGTEGRIWFDRV